MQWKNATSRCKKSLGNWLQVASKMTLEEWKWDFMVRHRTYRKVADVFLQGCIPRHLRFCSVLETKSRRRVICHCTGTRKKLRWMGKLKIRGGSGVENAEEIFPGSRCHYLRTGETPCGWWFFTPTKKNDETVKLVNQRIKNDETGLPGFWCHIRLRLKRFQRRLFMILNVHPETLGDMIQFDINLLCFSYFFNSLTMALIKKL